MYSISAAQVAPQEAAYVCNTFQIHCKYTCLTASLALLTKAEKAFLLLVARVRLTLWDALQSLLLLLASGGLVRPLAYRRQLVTHIVLGQDVVDAQDVRADA